MDLEKLRAAAVNVLSRDDIGYLIGWGVGSYGFRTAPLFLRDAGEVHRLTFSPLCGSNLAVFLTMEYDVAAPAKGAAAKERIAVMVKGCDSRAVVQQIVERGVDRERLFLVGCPCEGVVDPGKVEKKFPGTVEPVRAGWENGAVVFWTGGQKVTLPGEEVLSAGCLDCSHPNPVLADIMPCEEVKLRRLAAREDVSMFEQKSSADRWLYWKRIFNTCIRCYACRNACPLCYCSDCLLERLSPAWLFRSVNLSENAAFHLARAFHLAGRCVECGACERACPVEVPLMLLNRKLAREVYERYGFQPGLDPDSPPFQAAFRPDDSEEFIL